MPPIACRSAARPRRPAIPCRARRSVLLPTGVQPSSTSDPALARRRRWRPPAPGGGPSAGSGRGPSEHSPPPRCGPFGGRARPRAVRSPAQRRPCGSSARTRGRQGRRWLRSLPRWRSREDGDAGGPAPRGPRVQRRAGPLAARSIVVDGPADAIVQRRPFPRVHPRVVGANLVVDPLLLVRHASSSDRHDRGAARDCARGCPSSRRGGS